MSNFARQAERTAQLLQVTPGWKRLQQLNPDCDGATIGAILDLWPRTPSDGWNADGYSWALALTAALQALAALVMATTQRRGHAASR